MGPILLATDGSEYARQAAKRAIELAEEREATLHVICVVDQRHFDDPALSSAELATIYAEDHAAVCVRG
ncbi:universal stress protein [Halosolutus halophilus]|uniref:universal stress protein n=1 Tax=Halosolutus halophilus TaxID=1552990 RepID=UPI0022351701|nr:universal stress protein [Halosolutus halophilus]